MTVDLIGRLFGIPIFDFWSDVLLVAFGSTCFDVGRLTAKQEAEVGSKS